MLVATVAVQDEGGVADVGLLPLDGPKARQFAEAADEAMTGRIARRGVPSAEPWFGRERPKTRGMRDVLKPAPSRARRPRGARILEAAQPLQRRAGRASQVTAVVRLVDDEGPEPGSTGHVYEVPRSIRFKRGQDRTGPTAQG